MPLVTIGIPVFNEEVYLSATIDSALNQSFSDIEIVICDNCSTDNSFYIAKEHAKADSRIKLLKHPENVGPLENFRFCLEQANSKYFVWLGGHDIFCPDYIEMAINHLESHPEAVLVYPRNAVFIEEENKVIRAGACSDIEGRDTPSPVDRMTKVVRSLSYCTNIHGLFLTEILKDLPFEAIIGPDFLQLSLAALYGEIHALEIEGIQRRESFMESTLERADRWKKQGVYTDGWHDPFVLLVLKHIRYVIKSRQIGFTDKMKLCFLLPKVFNDSGLVKWKKYFYL